MIWNYIGGGLAALSLLAGAFAFISFIRTLLLKDSGLRLASKRAALLAIVCAGSAFLIMNTLAVQTLTETDIKAASDFVEKLEKQK
jgi:predicted neutral ceramidase superfamily lipid hydrolase